MSLFAQFAGQIRFARKRFFGLVVAAVAATVWQLPSLSEAAILVTEVDPTGSASTTNTYNADWFELTNTGASAVNISGWKIDDNSNAFANAVALRGVTSIPAGKSVVFMEGNSTGTTDATLEASFISYWFGASAPAGFTIGAYGGSGVGLSSSAGDAVNIFDAGGNRVTGVAFGAVADGVSFDNFAGLGSTTLPLPTISTLSVVGVHGAFSSFAAGGTLSAHEVGSPGVVPEPSTIVLAGMGLLGVAFGAWRRRANRVQ